MFVYVLFAPILFFFERSVLLTLIRYLSMREERMVDMETAQARFRLVALPRTAFLLLVPTSGAAADLLGASRDLITGILLLTTLIWLVVTLRDGWAAMKNAGA